nr:MAG TPA: Myogenic Basic domain [Caudoviricetes sp.]
MIIFVSLLIIYNFIYDRCINRCWTWACKQHRWRYS